jgi:hypothetical protein
MFIDTIAFQVKIDFFKDLVENPEFSQLQLPSCREAKIQVAKLERMTIAFRKKFPAVLLTTVPREKLGPVRGKDVHKVYQQSKVVERLFMKLIEGMTVDALRRTDGPKLTKGQVRSFAQKYVHRLNSRFQSAHKRVLKDAHASLLKK